MYIFVLQMFGFERSSCFDSKTCSFFQYLHIVLCIFVIQFYIILLTRYRYFWGKMIILKELIIQSIFRRFEVKLYWYICMQIIHVIVEKWIKLQVLSQNVSLTQNLTRILNLKASRTLIIYVTLTRIHTQIQSITQNLTRKRIINLN